MMNITVEDRASPWLKRLYRDQLPFVTSKAINATALDVQEAERKNVRAKFTVRRGQWVDRSIKIPRGGFATKTRLQAEVRVESPGRGDRSDILGKFEVGGIKRPQGRRLAIPQEVRRTKAGIVTRRQRPKAYNFRPHGRGKVFAGKTNVMVGDRRTVMIKKPGGKGGIFQRKGRGKRSELKLLFSFTPKAKIDKRLQFVDVGLRVVRRKFDDNFDREFLKAIRTAR